MMALSFKEKLDNALASAPIGTKTMTITENISVLEEIDKPNVKKHYAVLPIPSTDGVILKNLEICSATEFVTWAESLGYIIAPTQVKNLQSMKILCDQIIMLGAYKLLEADRSALYIGKA